MQPFKLLQQNLAGWSSERSQRLQILIFQIQDNVPRKSTVILKN